MLTIKVLVFNSYNNKSFKYYYVFVTYTVRLNQNAASLCDRRGDYFFLSNYFIDVVWIDISIIALFIIQLSYKSVGALLI